MNSILYYSYTKIEEGNHVSTWSNLINTSILDSILVEEIRILNQQYGNFIPMNSYPSYISKDLDFYEISPQRRDSMTSIRDKKLIFENINNTECIIKKTFFNNDGIPKDKYTFNYILNYMKSKREIFTRKELCATLLYLVSKMYITTNDYSETYYFTYFLNEYNWEYQLCIYLLKKLNLEDFFYVDKYGNNIIEYCLVNGYVEFLEILISKNLRFNSLNIKDCVYLKYNMLDMIIFKIVDKINCPSIYNE